MATKTWWLLNDVTPDLGAWRALSEGASSAVTIADGWVVGTGSTLHSAYELNVERASTTFVDTAPPSGTLNTSLKDAFRTEFAYKGTFAAGNWDLHFVVRAVTNGGAQDGRIRVRLIKAAADGSNATEITSAQQLCAEVINVSTSADFDSSLTLALPQFSVTDEYLFFQIAWERTGAGGMTSSDINWRSGDVVGPAGTRITSTDLAPPGAAAAPTVYLQAVRRAAYY
jgi:hypothetical protein